MRTIVEKPLQEMKVTLFAWNNKYILKFEMGPYEQTYKIGELDTAGDAEMLLLLENQSFIDSVLKKFEAMHQDFRLALA